MSKPLNTADRVIDALGGTSAVGTITDSSMARVSNWRARNKIPSEFYLIVTRALDDIGKEAAPHVFGIRQNGVGEGADRGKP